MTLNTDTAQPRGRPRSFDRDKALGVAMQLFWQQGYDGTSLTDLTTGMGIRPASLYAAFGSKEALFLEALERYRAGVGSGLPRIVKTAASAQEAIRSLLEGTAATITRRSQPRGCMIVLASLRGFTDSSEMDAELQRCRAEDQRIITDCLKSAVKKRRTSRNRRCCRLGRLLYERPAGHVRPGARRGRARSP